jgi:WD40 repeat protein
MRIVTVFFAAVVSLLTSTAGAVAFKAVAVSPDQAAIAVGGEGGLVVVWDSNTGKRTFEFVAKAAVHGLGFVRDARTLIVGADGAGVEVWTARGSGFVQTRRLGGTDMLYALAISPDASELAVSMNTGWVYFYRTGSWEPAGVLFEASNFISGLAFAPDGKSLATAGASFSVWDLGPGSKLRAPRANRDFDEIRSTSKGASRWARLGGAPMQDPYCTDIAFSPDGKFVAGTTGVGRMNTGGKWVRMWEAGTGRQIWQGDADGMLCIAFTADGKSVVTGSDDGLLRLWNSASGRLVKAWRGHGKTVRQIASLKDGSFVSAGDDGLAIRWDTTGKERARLRAD